MTLFIAIILIYGLQLHWSLYIVAVILWIIKIHRQENETNYIENTLDGIAKKIHE